MTDHNDATLNRGRFSRTDLEILAAAGMIEIIHPGTSEAAAFDRHVADGLDAYDARLLATEGPDALTSDRALRQAALAAELDPERVGYALAAFCHARDWDRSRLAEWLGLTLDQLATLALEWRADPGYPLDAGMPQVDLAERYGADPDRLAQVLAGEH